MFRKFAIRVVNKTKSYKLFLLQFKVIADESLDLRDY